MTIKRKQPEDRVYTFIELKELLDQFESDAFSLLKESKGGSTDWGKSVGQIELIQKLKDWLEIQ